MRCGVKISLGGVDIFGEQVGEISLGSSGRYLWGDRKRWVGWVNLHIIFGHKLLHIILGQKVLL